MKNPGNFTKRIIRDHWEVYVKVKKEYKDQIICIPVIKHNEIIYVRAEQSSISTLLGVTLPIIDMYPAIDFDTNDKRFSRIFLEFSDYCSIHEILLWEDFFVKIGCQFTGLSSTIPTNFPTLPPLESFSETDVSMARNLLLKYQTIVQSK